MMSMLNFIFDLDNTLIYTDLLNNISYNYALNRCELPPINYNERITREIVFKKYPNMNNKQKKYILELKQDYFIKNLHYTDPNNNLLKLLQSQQIDNCILWTSAYEPRAIAMLEYYNISNSFKKILFSDKTNITKDILNICKIFKCELHQLILYEDNKRVIETSKILKVNSIFVHPKCII